jgi:hypothetical protein
MLFGVMRNILIRLKYLICIADYALKIDADFKKRKRHLARVAGGRQPVTLGNSRRHVGKRY